MDSFSAPFDSTGQASAGATLYSRVAICFTFSCLATAAGAYLGRNISNGGFIVAIIAFFASYFLLFLVRKMEPINLIVLFAFTFIAGLTIGPAIAQYTSVPGGARVLVEAMLLCAVIFAGSAAFGWTTSLDLHGLSKYLMGALFALIAVGLLFLFITTSQAAEDAYDIGIAVVFVGFTALDFQRIRGTYDPSEYILATATIYLDALNLFLALLNLLSGNRRD